MASLKAPAKVALILALVAGGAIGASAQQITVNPTSISFGNVDLNVLGFARRVTLINHSTTRTYSLTSISFGLPNYTVNTGLPEQTLPPGAQVQFGFVFFATQAGNYNTTITFNVQGQTAVVLSVQATAVQTNAQLTFSSTSLNFGTVNFGSSSMQSVTVTNTGGGDPVTIEKVDSGANQSALNAIYYQPFSETGPIPPNTLQQGQSAIYNITFSPTTVGSTTAPFTLCYDVLPCNTVDLTGTGAMPTQLSLTTYPLPPWATQGAPYQLNVTAVGGTPPYQFRVSSGTMPAGLTMSKTGAITGTVSSTASTGNYTFTVQVQDASKPKRLSAYETLQLTLNPAPGANCNNTSADVGGTSTPIVDLMDLGTGTYCPTGANCSQCPFGENCEGGLYPGGSNTDPASHEADGVGFAQAIAAMAPPYVMVSLGESASQQPFEQFITEANADPEKNPNLVIVDGAEGGATAGVWTNSGSAYWDDLINYQLPFRGVNADEVAVAWISDVNSQQNPTFPSDATTLQANFESIAQILLTKFPNIKLMFFSSMNYTGYSNGISTTEPEPEAYESAFGAKWAIQDQINGNPNLNYNSANGPVLAPWMGWSAYYWANGMIPRSDGVTWSCQDLESDGLHPRDPIGHIKIGQYLLNWFKTSELTTPWFLAPSGQRDWLHN
jgi:hypothetical protein